MLTRICGWLLGVVCMAGVAVGVTAPWSPSGWLMLLVLGLAAARLLLARARRSVSYAIVSALLVLVGLRMLARGNEHARMITSPGDRSPRWLTHVFDEQDASQIGARVLAAAWRLPREERERLVPAMHAAYVAMRAEVGGMPSPLLDTFLDRQTPRGSDTLVFEPPVRARTAVVFLHGYTGSFTMPCWLVAQAARAIDAVTVCPATTFSGYWWSHDSEQIVSTTLAELHARGIERIYLVGLSNGAVGAARIASRLSAKLAGLVLISGAPSEGAASVPTLVIQGEQDTVASAAEAHAYAARAQATYRGYPAGHFVLLTHPESRAALASWFKARERRD